MFSKEAQQKYVVGVEKIADIVALYRPTRIYILGNSARIMMGDIKAYLEKWRVTTPPVLEIDSRVMPDGYLPFIQKDENAGHKPIIIDDVVDEGHKNRTLRTTGISRIYLASRDRQSDACVVFRNDSELVDEILSARRSSIFMREP